MTTEIKVVDITPETEDYAKKIKSMLTVNEDGNIVEKEENAVTRNCMSETEFEETQRSQRRVSLIATGFMKAAGELAIEHKKANPDTKRVAGIIKLGLDELAFNYTAPNGKKPDGSWKEPSVSVITRRLEHADHVKVRQAIYEATKSIMD